MTQAIYKVGGFTPEIVGADRAGTIVAGWVDSGEYWVFAAFDRVALEAAVGPRGLRRSELVFGVNGIPGIPETEFILLAVPRDDLPRLDGVPGLASSPRGDGVFAVVEPSAVPKDRPTLTECRLLGSVDTLLDRGEMVRGLRRRQFPDAP